MGSTKATLKVGWLGYVAVRTVGSVLGFGFVELFFIPGVATLSIVRSVTLTVVSMVLLFPGPIVQTFWMEYFCSFLGRRLIQYGGSGDTLKYFGWVGIRRDGATVISKLSGPIRVSMSEKSLVGETEVSASGKSSRYSSMTRFEVSSASESYIDETSDTFFFKMLFNFAGLAIPEHPDGDRCTRCRAE